MMAITASAEGSPDAVTVAGTALTQQADGSDDDELLLRRQLLDGKHVRAAAARSAGQRRDRVRHVPDAHERRAGPCATWRTCLSYLDSLSNADVPAARQERKPRITT